MREEGGDLCRSIVNLVDCNGKKIKFSYLVVPLVFASLSVLDMSVVFSFACTFLVLACSSQLDFIRGFPVSTVMLPVFFLPPWCLHTG
jgi:hypothetical protein